MGRGVCIVMMRCINAWAHATRVRLTQIRIWLNEKHVDTHRRIVIGRRRRDNATDQRQVSPFFNLLGRGPLSLADGAPCTLASTNDTAKIHPRSFSRIHRRIPIGVSAAVDFKSSSLVYLVGSFVTDREHRSRNSCNISHLWNAVIRLRTFTPLPILSWKPQTNSFTNYWHTTSRSSKCLSRYRSVLMVILFFLLCNNSS